MIHIVGKPAPSSQRLKQLGQYANSPSHRGYCYAELPGQSNYQKINFYQTDICIRNQLAHHVKRHHMS